MHSCGSFGPAKAIPKSPTVELHVSSHITEADIIGEIDVKESLVNGLGEENGRFWTSNGLRVGWQGAELQAIRELAIKIGSTGQLKGSVTHEFLLDEIFKWLRETLENKRSDSLSDYIAQRCSTEIKDYEIWIPVFRTYSSHDFSIGGVQFRTVSKSMMDALFANAPQEVATQPEVMYAINRERSEIQGSIAACLNVKAEEAQAREIAHRAANDAIGLLRFLSPASTTCKVVSHCLPVGRENMMEARELFVLNGAIKSIRKASIERGPTEWNVDQARHNTPGLLEALDKIASTRSSTPFLQDLDGALQLHSRHSVAVEVSHKVVFVVASIESFLLKDANEPIQKNLGERMAFVIGNSLQERKEIIRNVDQFYVIAQH